MKGILQEVSGNTVKINDVYYDATNVQHFLPKSVNIEVEFNHNSDFQLTYIRPITQSKGTKTKNSFTPKRLSRKTKTQTTPSSSLPSTSDTSRSEKIAKQLLLKIADNKTNNFSFASIDDALNALDEVYKKLKERYLNEIK